MLAMEQQEQLKTYIYQQLQSGLNPDEITSQLRGAGWDEASINSAFQMVQSNIVPTPPSVPHVTTNTTANITQTQILQHYEPLGKKRGRLKTAWLLLKQSVKILKSNKQLLRYSFMSGLLSTLITIIFALIFVLGGDALYYKELDIFGDEDVYPTNLGLIVGFVYYIIVFFTVFIYNAGLAAHVLDIFRGKSLGYSDYMKRAWGKAKTLFVYSVITAVVGVILRALERNRLLGFVVSKILGLLWAFANLFTIPIIVENDIGAIKAIKRSMQLFKSRWGENIAARIGFSGIALLIYLLIMIPIAVLLFIVGAAFGGAGIIVAFGLVLLSVIAFAIIETAASQVLSVALYYYAQYQQVPANFTPELLNAALIPKKKRRK